MEALVQARELAARYGSVRPGPTARRLPAGRCVDCRRQVPARFTYAVRELAVCEDDYEHRARVARDAATDRRRGLRSVATASPAKEDNDVTTTTKED